MSNPYDPATPRDKTALMTEALARRDNTALLALLADDGSDGNWCDDRGQTLLHFAALRGDEALCDALIYKKGFSAQARNEDGDTPARMAAIFGHERLAQQLGDIERRQHSATPLTMPPVASLNALRARRGGAGLDPFYDYASAGRFDMVVAAALASGQNLSGADLLAQGQKGDSVALRLCQSGQLPVLLTAGLWQTAEALAVLRQVRASLPADYRRQIDATGLLRQTVDQSAGQTAGQTAGQKPDGHLRFGQAAGVKTGGVARTPAGGARRFKLDPK